MLAVLYALRDAGVQHWVAGGFGVVVLPLEAHDRLGVPPEAAVMVDDQMAFCRAARALGMDTVQIVRDACPTSSPPAAPSDSVIVVASLADLMAQPALG